MVFGTNPRHTIKLSKTLNPSSKYSKTPNANSFNIISMEKMQLNITLLISSTYSLNIVTFTNDEKNRNPLLNKNY